MNEGAHVMKIVVAGVGYVGLVTAVTLADVGHDVICLDVDKGKLKMHQPKSLNMMRTTVFRNIM